MKTIVALATPPMNAAIHIIRISGSNAFNIVNKLVSNKISKKGYCIHHTKIMDNNQIIDDVLINTFVAPKSFTGEDLIEINCHGGYYLANKIIQLLIKFGCILALPGEFTQRAYMNNKLTFHEAESINNLINATSSQAIALANSGLNKQAINELKDYKEQLFQLVGQVEVNIDYPEFDDIPTITIKQFKTKINQLIKISESIVKNSLKVIPILEGINVAIVGRPNVGKSSLFNALLQQQRAIVSNIPGTTRDMIDAKINIGGITINLIDTAGLRTTKNLIEKKGLTKSYESIDKANLILWVVDGSKKLSQEDKDIQNKLKNKNYLIVINKSDLPIKVSVKGLKISVKNNKIQNLVNYLIKTLQTNIHISPSNIILQSTRSIGFMQHIVEELSNVQQLIQKKQPLDLALEHLRIVLININNILGNTKEYNFVNELFRKFCVGK